MWRALVATVTVLAAGVLAWEFVPLAVTIWDGGFDLTVRIESPAGRPRSVTCESFGRREYADEAVALLRPPQSRSWSAVADPFDGRPLTVPVAVSGRDSPLGRKLRRFQFRFLAVIAVLPDGSQVGKVVEIPDGRASREVLVILP
jgi:hypothetical protein